MCSASPGCLDSNALSHRVTTEAAVDLVGFTLQRHQYPQLSVPFGGVALPGNIDRRPDTVPASSSTERLASIAPDVSVALLRVASPALASSVISRRSDADAAPPPTSAALDISSLDAIDESFIDVRIAIRRSFTAFANQLGYLDKQLYIAFNFAESIVASAVFNGTDILRSEGLLKNLGEFGRDVVQSALFIVIDEVVLATPETDGFDYTERAPWDAPDRWENALSPEQFKRLAVPGEAPEDERSRTLAVEPDGDTSSPTDHGSARSSTGDSIDVAEEDTAFDAISANSKPEYSVTESTSESESEATDTNNSRKFSPDEPGSKKPSASESADTSTAAGDSDA
jgi:hypothetical protein